MAITKHRMNRIYCCLKKVKQLYLKRKGKGKWDKGEEHDDQIFLDMEKKIYLEMYPIIRESLVRMKMDQVTRMMMLKT